MKRILTLVMMLTAVIVLAACGTSKEKSAEKDQSSADQETIIIGIDDKFAPMGFRDEKMKSWDSILI